MNINKIFYTLFLGFMISVFYNPLAIAKCKGNDIATDIIRGVYGCNCKNGDPTDYNKKDGVKGNFRIFVDFPDMYYCYTSLVDDDRWRDAKEYLCPGFKYNNYNEETMIPKAQHNGPLDGNGCWKWECKEGFILNPITKTCKPKPAEAPTAENTVLCDDTSRMNNITIGETTYNNVPKNVVFDGKCVKVCEKSAEVNEKSNIIIADETEFSIRLQ
ncbi:MAG: hypothetical protein GX944_02825 [Alphaproteobacteria bacterium]|jgi:hypothetical protein|nr:hypothetical protein [Alphaproteobacteria bacterium]